MLSLEFTCHYLYRGTLQTQTHTLTNFNVTGWSVGHSVTHVVPKPQPSRGVAVLVTNKERYFALKTTTSPYRSEIFTTHACMHAHMHTNTNTKTHTRTAASLLLLFITVYEFLPFSYRENQNVAFFTSPCTKGKDTVHRVSFYHTFCTRALGEFPFHSVKMKKITAYCQLARILHHCKPGIDAPQNQCWKMRFVVERWISITAPLWLPEVTIYSIFLYFMTIITCLMRLDVIHSLYGLALFFQEICVSLNMYLFDIEPRVKWQHNIYDNYNVWAGASFTS